MNPKIREAVKLAMADPHAAYDKLAGHNEISRGMIRAMLSRQFVNSEMDAGDTPFTLESWLKNNAEYVDHEDLAGMFAMDVGESYTTGGGAGARITTTRVR